jgi:O-antigen/teichoic acid export membrane protein
LIRITTLLSGNGLTALLMLVRNLVLAHLLGVEDYGLVVALVIITAAAEMATTLGLPQLIVSHKLGAACRFQATLHVVQLARAVSGAGIVLLCATPLATMLDAPESAPILRAAALVPLILGFTHLDPFRAQRHRVHLPQVLVISIAALISVAAIWPLSLWQAGPQIMLYLLLTQACASVVVSHLISRRPYRLHVDLTMIGQVLQYGLPLTLNGIVLFAVLHAEKLIAGAGLGLADMSVVAMGFTLTMTPALVMARSFQAFHLPKLRRDRAPILGLSMLLGASLCVSLAALVPLFLPLLEAGFNKLDSLVPILSCLAAMRLPKSALATTALAEGRTHLPAVANTPRLLAAPLIWFVLENGGGIEALLAIATAAEVVGIVIGVVLARAVSFPIQQFAIASLVLVLVASGQLLLATLACGLGWGLYALGPTPIHARRAT